MKYILFRVLACVDFNATIYSILDYFISYIVIVVVVVVVVVVEEEEVVEVVEYVMLAVIMRKYMSVTRHIYMCVNYRTNADA